MIVYFSTALTMALASLNPTVEIQRQERQDTIYLLRGDTGALEAFRNQIGSGWTGGTLIDRQMAEGVLSYWAYSDRTAAESRAFMMPAMFSGLDLSIEAYEEAKSFPVERGKLDLVAAKCGATIDPFFVTPLRSLEINIPENAGPGLERCLSEGAREVDPELPIRTPRKSNEEK